MHFNLCTFGPHKKERCLISKFDKNFEELSDLSNSSKFFDINIS